MGSTSERIISLAESSAGDDLTARDELLVTLYDELKRIAHKILRDRPRDVLQSTVLVHDAYLRLVGRQLRVGRDVEWTGNHHFLCYMARTMRSVLADALRKGGEAAKEAKQVPIHELSSCIAVPHEDRTYEVLVLDEALNRLANDFPDLAKVEELRIFGGFTMAETAEILDCDMKKVKVARAYLRDYLGDDA